MNITQLGNISDYIFVVLPPYLYTIRSRFVNSKVDLLGKRKIENKSRQLIQLTYIRLNWKPVLLSVAPSELNQWMSKTAMITSPSVLT